MSLSYCWQVSYCKAASDHLVSLSNQNNKVQNFETWSWRMVKWQEQGTTLIQDRRVTIITVSHSNTFQKYIFTKIDVMDRIILFPGSMSSSRYCEMLDLENQIINIMYIYNRLDIMLKELEVELPGILCNSYTCVHCQNDKINHFQRAKWML